MGKVARIGRRQQRASLHDVVAHQRHQHRVFDIMVKRVAVADTFDRQPGDRRYELGQVGMRGAEPAAHMLGKEGPRASAANSGTVIK